jgi:hypothetical protein
MEEESGFQWISRTADYLPDDAVATHLADLIHRLLIC